MKEKKLNNYISIYIGMRFDYYLKMLVLGDTGVGKTCLMQGICDEEVPLEHTPTIGIDFKSVTQKDEDGNIVKLQIWDAAGNPSFRSIVQTYCSCVCGVIIVFDISKRDTFRSIKDWYEMANTGSGFAQSKTRLPLVIVANKRDLSQRRVVTYKEGLDLARELNGKYIETSARGGINVEGLKNGIITAMMEIARKKRFEELNKPVPSSEKAAMRYVKINEDYDKKIKCINCWWPILRFFRIR